MVNIETLRLYLCPLPSVDHLPVCSASLLGLVGINGSRNQLALSTDNTRQLQAQNPFELLCATWVTK